MVVIEILFCVVECLPVEEGRAGEVPVAVVGVLDADGEGASDKSVHIRDGDADEDAVAEDGPALVETRIPEV